MPSDSDSIKQADTLIVELRKVLHGHAYTMGDIPGLLKRILKDGLWKRRVVKSTRQEVEFNSFFDFVTTPPLEGLGTTIALLKDACRSDLEALDLLDKETVGEHGGDRHSEEFKADIVSLEAKEGPEHGNARTYALRRLRAHRPDLHTAVLSGDLTPHAAMIEAGFRRKTITIQLDPEKAAKTLKNKLTSEELAVLIAALLAH